MKIFLLLISTSLFSNTSTGILKKPKFLKSLTFRAGVDSDDNFSKVDRNLLEDNSNFNTNNLDLLSAKYSINSKMLFKPYNKYLLINKTDANFTHQPFDAMDGVVNPQRLDPRNSFSVNNDLLGLFLLNKTLQVGHRTNIGYESRDSFQINPESANNFKVQTLDADQFTISQNFFTQLKPFKYLTTRLAISSRLQENDSDYAVFQETRGEQNDNLSFKSTLENTLKLGKIFTFSAPISYEKTLYKSRFALDQQGKFITTGLKKRDTLEKTQIIPTLSLNHKIIDISLSYGLAKQRDLSFGGRDYSGFQTSLNSNIKFNNFSISPFYSYSNFDYKTAELTTGERWLESTTRYGVNLYAYQLFHPSLTFDLGYEKEDTKDNFFAGKYKNQKFISGVTVNL